MLFRFTENTLQALRLALKSRVADLLVAGAIICVVLSQVLGTVLSTVAQPLQRIPVQLEVLNTRLAWLQQNLVGCSAPAADSAQPLFQKAINLPEAHAAFEPKARRAAASEVGTYPKEEDF